MADLAVSPLKEVLEKLLADGLPTAWRQRANSDAGIRAITTRLRGIAPQSFAAKLHIAGFTDHPYNPPSGSDIEQACSTCMYYERHRGHCNHPQLDLPVKPEWSCVLWRI
jgi:hypothetical protein